MVFQILLDVPEQGRDIAKATASDTLVGNIYEDTYDAPHWLVGVTVFTACMPLLPSQNHLMGDGLTILKLSHKLRFGHAGRV